MKPTSISTIEYRLARHDRRARGNRAFPITDYFFRPQAETKVGRATRDSSSRAFRRMMATMMTKKDQLDWLEIAIHALVVAIVAWPIIELIITLAQTANG